MKKSVLVGLFLMLSIFSFAGVLAEGCDLDISLINQEPYPAIPGDYVKLVFQVDGVSNPECEEVDFELLEQYPLIFDPDEVGRYTINSGIYDQDFSSYLLAHYKVRVDEDALDGVNPIEVQYRFGGNIGFETKKFNLEVEDTRADFEVHIKDYDLVTKIMTFEILNIAEDDVEALTIEIPKQDGVIVKGSNINIEGDLDSNDYLTTSFEVNSERGFVSILLKYTDSINERRVVEKNVFFEPEYFEGRVADQKKSPVGTYVVLIVVIFLIVWWVLRRKAKKKKALEARRRK